MDGEFQTAYRAAKDLESHAHSQAFVATQILVLSRFARWNKVLALSQPQEKLRGLTFFWRYARGCAFASKGQPQKASEERAAMDAVYQQIPPGRAFGMFFNDWSTLHELASDALNARIAVARHDAATAIEYWRQGVAVQDQMNFDDLPDWYYPLRESLGAQLFRCGQLAEAERVFREDVVRNPRNPRSLFGLWKVLECEKRTADAGWVKREFQAAWKGAASDLRIEDF